MNNISLELKTKKCGAIYYCQRLHKCDKSGNCIKIIHSLNKNKVEFTQNNFIDTKADDINNTTQIVKLAISQPANVERYVEDYSNYRLCNHPNDTKCIQSNACFSNGICSIY